MERRTGILWEKAVGGQRFEQKNVSVSTRSGKEVQGRNNPNMLTSEHKSKVELPGAWLVSPADIIQSQIFHH